LHQNLLDEVQGPPDVKYGVFGAMLQTAARQWAMITRWWSIFGIAPEKIAIPSKNVQLVALYWKTNK
jgi:hypothetical protein